MSADEVIQAVSGLSSGPPPSRERVLEALHGAAQIVDADELEVSISEASGLSEGMVSLCSSLATEVFDEEGLTALAEQCTPLEMDGHAALVLAGNVFTAGLKPISELLFRGARVAVREPARCGGYISAFAAAIAQADEELGQRVSVVSYDHDDEAAHRALLGDASITLAYGSDASVDALRSKTSGRFVGHGHGFSAALVRGEDDIAEAAAGLALDVAAYDQMGCLSPAFVFVHASVAAPLAERLHLELEELGEWAPRGKRSSELKQRERSFRTNAQALGVLFEGKAHSVALPEEGSGMSAGFFRNVPVLSFRDESEISERLAKTAGLLKSIGADGPVELAGAIHRPLGSMQQPQLADELEVPKDDAT